MLPNDKKSQAKKIEELIAQVGYQDSELAQQEQEISVSYNHSYR
jgi:hypothetical protein